MEYRVFCPSPGDIAAISQYHWHRPLVTPQGRDHRKEYELDEYCNWVYLKANAINDKVRESQSVTQRIMETGYSFDIVIIGDSVELIELNPFGAMTG